MTGLNKTSIYRYRCQACAHDISIPFLKCANCGLTSGEFETDHPNLNYQTVCSKCRAELVNAPLPNTCQACGTTKNAWWNLNNNQCYQPNLSLLEDIPTNAIWISGDFNGHYSGNKINTKTITHNHRHYDLVIDNGKLVNVIKIKEPPFSLQNDEPYPIRQAFVTSTINSPSFDKNFKITLFDFRLHFPEKTAYKEISRNDTIIGNISGKAYAYIKQPEDMPPAPGLDENTKSDTNTSNESESPLNDSTHSSNVNSTNPASPTVDSPANCFTCWFVTLLISGLGLWICCDWHLALIGTSVMGITCLLDQLLVKNNSKIESTFNRISLGTLLVILSIFGIGYYGFLLNLTHCTNTPIWPLFLSGISLVLSAWISSCLLRSLLTGLWLIALLVWCGTNQVGSCNQINDHSNNNNIVQPLIDNLHHVAETTINQIPDTDSAIINQIPNNNSHLITLEQAFDNPELLNDCKNHLYLPSATIFAFDQATIDPSMDINLEKLVHIIQKSPPKKIIITGYTDGSGDDTVDGFNHNIELSQNRANAVASWLIQNGNIAAEQIDARGAGSKFPLTHVVGQQSLNRRVEIKLNYLDCKPN